MQSFMSPIVGWRLDKNVKKTMFVFGVPDLSFHSSILGVQGSPVLSPFSLIGGSVKLTLICKCITSLKGIFWSARR